jgi:hypothetical protein
VRVPGLTRGDLAIEQAQKEHPELFDFNDGYGKLSWRVLNRKKYYDLVKYNLERMGCCAAHEEERSASRTTTASNEQFQIMSSLATAGGAGAYRATCWPPWFLDEQRTTTTTAKRSIGLG